MVREITPAGASTIVAGVLNGCGYNADGISATTAQLSQPYGVALDSAGNIYIGDAGNNRVRKVTISTGLISTVAGNGTCGYQRRHWPGYGGRTVLTIWRGSGCDWPDFHR